MNELTYADYARFDELIEMQESQSQIARIKSRTEWPEFEKRFTKEQLDEMWKLVNNKSYKKKIKNPKPSAHSPQAAPVSPSPKAHNSSR